MWEKYFWRFDPRPMCTLTSIRRVGCRAIEESGRASQVGHAGIVSIAIHGAGNGSVTGLLGRGAGRIPVRRHATAAAHETCRKCGGKECGNTDQS